VRLAGSRKPKHVRIVADCASGPVLRKLYPMKQPDVPWPRWLRGSSTNAAVALVGVVNAAFA
jgi:hypothetical protein